MEPVKFVALDRDDLEVVSTHLQDALVKVADVMWRPQEKRLVVALSRFDWLSAEGTKPELRRCRSRSNAWKPSWPIWGHLGPRACVPSMLTIPPTRGVDGLSQPRH